MTASVGGRLFSMSPLNVPISKEITKNILEDQYSARVSQTKKHNTLLIIAFSQVENIKSKTLFYY